MALTAPSRPREGGGTKIYRGGRNMHSGGHFFLFICGEYEDGIMQATGGNLESITQGDMYIHMTSAQDEGDTQ